MGDFVKEIFIAEVGSLAHHGDIALEPYTMSRRKKQFRPSRANSNMIYRCSLSLKGANLWRTSNDESQSETQYLLGKINDVSTIESCRRLTDGYETVEFVR